MNRARGLSVIQVSSPGIWWIGLSMNRFGSAILNRMLAHTRPKSVRHNASVA